MDDAAPVSVTPLPPALLAELRDGRGTPGLLVAGGSFDPPHEAHVRLCETARRSWLAAPDAPPRAWLIFVPAARSPFKHESPAAGDQERVEMLRLATGQIERSVIWTDELDRARLAQTAGAPSAPSYTIDTLTRLAHAAGGPGAKHPVPLRLVIGSDQAARLHEWKSPREILNLAPPIVLGRAPLATRASLRQALAGTGFWDAADADRIAGALVEHPPMEHAASDIRAALRGGRWNDVERLLNGRVIEFIRSKGLYLRP
ncbi:MAG: nicotinate-nicotinamide nucleotide adenylyltransferase [Phycisphaerales bacterium]